VSRSEAKHCVTTAGVGKGSSNKGDVKGRKKRLGPRREYDSSRATERNVSKTFHVRCAF